MPNQRSSLFSSFNLRLIFLILLPLLAAFLLSACVGSPEAQLNASVTRGEAPLSVSFTNTSENADEFRWDFGDGTSTTTAAPEEVVTHEYTKVGTFTVTLNAIQERDPPETSTATVAVTVEPGPLDHVNLAALTIQVTQEQSLSATALDQFDNPIPDLSFTFRSDDQAGQIDTQGGFTAGTSAGSFDDAVTVEVSQGSVTRTASATVTVEPGPLDHVNLAALTIQVTQAQSLSATALDQFDNPIPDLSFTFRSDDQAGQIDTQGGFTAGTSTGSFDDAVTVEVSQGSVTRTASTTVTIEPGPLDHVNLEPAASTIQVTQEQSFSATALDQFDNPIPGLSFTFRSDDQAGQIDTQGRFTAGTSAGSFDDAVTVEVSQGSVTRTASTTVTVERGPLDRVLISPETVTLNIGRSQTYSAVAADAYDNPIPEAQISWSTLQGVGIITDEGLLTTGTQAATFAGGVRATAKLGTRLAIGAASVVVNPDPLDTLTFAPIEITAGVTHQLDAIATDQHGNRLSEVEVTLTIRDANAGTVTQAGLIISGEVAGSFAGAIEGQATQGDLIRTVTADVTITPGPLEQVVVAPNSVAIGMDMTQQFVAVGADQFGNRISGLAFTWSIEAGGGTVDENGFFAAGDSPGTYKKTVQAQTTQGSITRSATATVKPDRIAFTSDRTDNQLHIYVMDLDGANVEQITGGWNIGFPFAFWSPDGRRIVFDSCPFFCEIVVINDDGTWGTLLSGQNGAFPSWSPDGEKIAFASTRDGSSEIYVMDVAGFNQRRLTDNSAFDDTPSWSPDGQKIVFSSFRFTDFNWELYVMNADGSGETRLTNNPALDDFASWSPDGSQILFHSDRDGDFEIYVMNADGTNVRQLTSNVDIDTYASWSPDGSLILFSSDREGDFEIYMMDPDGSNVTRLTNDPADDLIARWAPRKRGLDVSEESVVISNASALQPIKLTELISKVRGSVVFVLVDTDLGQVSGSGFIIDPDGLIVTNNHVISDASEITIFLDDSSSYTGTVVGRDVVRDLAVVKIEASGLPALELGDQSQVQLGTEVIVLGFPLGLPELSVTRGIISSFRSNTGSNITWIQTDSAVNPGNSGGPLLNPQGQVIGIVTDKFVGVSIEGAGLAVSVNTIKVYLERLIEGEVIGSFAPPPPLQPVNTRTPETSQPWGLRRLTLGRKR